MITLPENLPAIGTVVTLTVNDDDVSIILRSQIIGYTASSIEPNTIYVDLLNNNLGYDSDVVTFRDTGKWYLVEERNNDEKLILEIDVAI